MKKIVSVLSCALLFSLPELASAAIQPLSDDLGRTTTVQDATQAQELQLAKKRRPRRTPRRATRVRNRTKLSPGKSSSK